MTRSPILTLIQAPIASRFGPWLLEADGRPVTHRRRRSARARADPSPEPDVLPARDLDDVEQAVQVEVDHRRPTTPGEVDDAGVLGALDEGVVGLADEQVGRVLGRELLHRLDVALGHEEIHEAVVVDVLELGVPGGGVPGVTARIGVRGGRAHLPADVRVVRPLRTIDQRLEHVVGLVGQEDLRPAIAVDVLAGDAHAPDPQELPALIPGVQPRRLTGGHLPELLLAIGQVAVVVMIVATRAGRAARRGPSR